VIKLSLWKSYNKSPPSHLMRNRLAGPVAVVECATVKGVGRDIESVGKAGQEAID